MKTLTTLLASLAVTCTFLSQPQAQAQVVHRPVVVPASYFYNVPTPYTMPRPIVRHWPYPYHRYHASTAAESYMRGVAAVTRARGEYNLLSSQAAINAEHARSLGLDNSKKTAETYFEMRKINKESRAAERGPRPTKEDLVRLARTAAPDRLTADRLNRATGQIAWPAALQGDQFAAYRTEIERVFAERAANGGMGMEQRQDLEQATGTMLVLLKNDIRQFPPMEYSSARRFIESLAYEAHVPTT